MERLTNMEENSLHESRQHFVKRFILSLLVLLIADAGYILVPTIWRSSYVLLASIIMMVDIFILTDQKPLLDKEKRIRLIWILSGLANISVALAFMFFEFSLGITIGAALAILQVSSYLTSLVIIQRLKNKQVVL